MGDGGGDGDGDVGGDDDGDGGGGCGNHDGEGNSMEAFLYLQVRKYLLRTNSVHSNRLKCIYSTVCTC